jgi:hypothetical protein
MNHKQKNALAVAIAAGVGGMTVTDDAAAAAYGATLISMYHFYNEGSSAANFSSSTGLSWSYDDVTQLMTQTGGTLNARTTNAPTTTLFRHLITGLVFGNGGAASASSFSCVEGNFGPGVGASICGNYSFGGNFVNESTSSWGPGTAASRTLGGDDYSNGPQQSVASQYSGFSTISWVGTTLRLEKKYCTGYCTSLPAGSYNGSFQYTFSVVPVPAAVWLFGSALGVMGLMRRKSGAQA